MDVSRHNQVPAIRSILQQDDDADRPQCGSGGTRGSYNLSLHVFALFLILILSTIACSFPIIVRRFPRFPVPHRFLFLSRHFGTGVLIATAFVHLLPTAFVSLTDPCLPAFWNQGYPAMAGFVAMCAVLVVVGIEMFFATRGARHVHGESFTVPEEEESGLLGTESLSNGYMRLANANGHPLQDPQADAHQSEPRRVPYNEQNDDEELDGQLHMSKSDKVLEEDPLASDEADLRPDGVVGGTHFNEGGRASGPQDTDRHPQQHGFNATHAEKQAEQRLLLQCLLLEAGILFHSVFIGMALSVAVGTPFVVLLIAISFHQTFEGLALGARIAAIKAFGPQSPKPWLMALAYGTTTPIGQAIGLVMHNLYDPHSQTGLLLVGIMNAISSGLLLFAGLVELLAEDFLSEKSYETLRGKKRIEACCAVVLGSLLMAFVGAFA